METNNLDVKTGRTGGADIHDVLRSCHSTMNYSPLPLVAVEGQEHTVRYVNPAFCQLVGKAVEELMGHPYVFAVPEREANGGLALLDRVYRTGATETLADQEHAPAALSNALLSDVYRAYVAWPVRVAEGRTVAVILQVTDTSGLARFYEQMTAMNQKLLLSSIHQHELRGATDALNVKLQALATIDGLTGLSNHRAFQEHLQEEVKRARRYKKPLSLLFIDADNFKSYNDAFGHPAGDEVLRKIGEVLRSTARTSDVAARYGGEEFAVILTDTEAESAIAVAERFRAAVEWAGWPERQITVSVGIATLSDTVRNPATLIVEADKALYRSKAHGRNCVTYINDAYIPTT